jgi:hypothetical protein
MRAPQSLPVSRAPYRNTASESKLWPVVGILESVAGSRLKMQPIARQELGNRFGFFRYAPGSVRS